MLMLYDGLLGVGDGLALGDLANQSIAGLGKAHDGRGGAGTFGVGDDFGFTVFEQGNTGVGRAQVDTDDLAHRVLPLYCGRPRCSEC